MPANTHQPRRARVEEDYSDRFTFVVDEQAQPGNVTRALATLLLGLARREREQRDRQADDSAVENRDNCERNRT